MKKIITLVALLFSLAVPATAQTVLADRVLTGAPKFEFMPRFATYLPNVLVVKAGETVTLASGTLDAIEVQAGGTLKCNRSAATTVFVTHLYILPGGVFDCGTEADPVLTLTTIVIRDVPIDTTKDPYQWGNGVINFGKWLSFGRKVTPFISLTADALAGETTLQTNVPADWSVGDDLFLPEFHQVSPQAPIKKEEARLQIAGISADRQTIFLSRPLEISHASVIDPDGQQVLAPRVANLARSIYIVSENALGTRGHTVDIGAQTTWDMEYTAFYGLGRTLADTLDSTSAATDGTITHIGTNQIAKYATHFHHTNPMAVGGPARYVGNVVDGTDFAKWGLSIHQSHYTYVADNIFLRFVGSGLVTEDGPEFANVIARNLVSGTKGNGGGAPTNANPTGKNAPGSESGMWFRGLRNYFIDNEAYNSQIGINFFGLNQMLGRYPSQQGGALDTQYTPSTVPPMPFLVDGNIAVSNASAGIESWNTESFENRRALAAYNGSTQFNTGHANTLLVDVTAICGQARTLAIDSATGYTGQLEVNGGRVAGCDRAFANDGAIEFFRLRNLTLQNKVNISFPEGGFIARELLFENIVHKDLPGFPRKWVIWGGTPRPNVPPSFRAWNPSQGTRGLILNWQGTGQNYRLYTPQQLRSQPAVTANGARGYEYFCPEAGISVGDCWDKYGLANNGGVVDALAALTLDGLTGYVEPGTVTTLGPARWAITSPNMLAPARVETVNGTQRVKAFGQLTGSKVDAAEFAYVSVDGAAAKKVTRGAGQFGDELSFFLTGSQLTPGTHTVRTHRVTSLGLEVPGSTLIFQYYVGDPTPTPTHALAVTTTGTGQGVVSGAGTYDEGTVVGISATPAEGSTFDGWMGDADCADGVVTMDADKVCTAVFTLLPPPPPCDGLVGQTGLSVIGGRTFTVQILDPQCGASAVWVP